ncbi:MAG: hypothetical protein R3E84_22000 [Pseudomonadales bacterium]
MTRLADALDHLEQGRWVEAHAIVQDDDSVPGCWAHGIVHILEGDLANARYWYRRAGRTLPTAPVPADELKALRTWTEEHQQ